MGRRARYTSDQLRDVFVQAAYEIVETRGLNGLSARTLALKVGYAPGTIYNVFSNLDDLVLNVEARMLIELDQHLEVATVNSSGANAVIDLASAFVDFACKRPNLWNLLAANQLSTRSTVPEWYSERLEAPERRIAKALLDEDKTILADEAKQHARTITVFLYGIAVLATSNKTKHLTNHQAPEIVGGLVRGFLASLHPLRVGV